MNKLNVLKIVLIIATLAGVCFASGGNRVGTAGSTQLLIPVGPRGIAMGYTTVTDSRGVEAIFWNPANVALDEGSSVMFSSMNYLADINVMYGAIAINTGSFGSLAFSVKSLSMDDINVTTSDYPDGTGEVYKPQFLTTGLTYSMMLSDRVSIGITGNLNMERLADVSKTNVSFNAGISYNNLGNIDGLVMGIAIKNLGPKSKFEGSGLNIAADEMPDYLRSGRNYYSIATATDDLPTTLEIGLGYKYDLDENNSLRVNGMFQNSNFYYDEYRVGLEYDFSDVLFLRGGYILTPEIDSEDARESAPLCAGFGLKLNLGTGLDFKFDYAYQKRNLFSDGHVFGVIFSF